MYNGADDVVKSFALIGYPNGIIHQTTAFIEEGGDMILRDEKKIVGIITSLNMFGTLGWELVSHHRSEKQNGDVEEIFYFKRQK